MIVPDDPKRHIVAEYGSYAIWYDPLPHRPYGLFRVYSGERYVGAQISWPTNSDCDWLARASTRPATRSCWPETSEDHTTSGTGKRRGRPRKDVSLRELREAIAG